MVVAGEEQTQDGNETRPHQKAGLEANKIEENTNSQDPWKRAFDYLFQESRNDNIDEFREKSEKLLTKCAEKLCSSHILQDYHIVFLWTRLLLSDLHLNRIHQHLKTNKSKEGNKKDVLLIIDSDGGSIEPAFQISKICNIYKKNKFIVAVPRRAKSAATLIAIGANEIHMGDLSQLGPIDPQLGPGLPALGIHDALNALAKVVKMYPESVNLFSIFLDKKIDLQILGWLTRVPESASQYAQKLLAINYGKDEYRSQVKKIAKDLVETYKDHGFVIDSEEIKTILGDKVGEGMIKSNSKIMNEIEEFYLNLSEFETYANLSWIQDDGSRLQINFIGQIECKILSIGNKR